MVVRELAPLGLHKLEQHNGASSVVTIKAADLIRQPKFQAAEDILQTRGFKIPITLSIYLNVGDVINICQIVNT